MKMLANLGLKLHETKLDLLKQIERKKLDYEIIKDNFLNNKT